MLTMVWTTFRMPGLHRWPAASTFLLHPHRHLFHVKAQVEATHDDREIEFLDFQRRAQQLFSNYVDPELEETVPYSCEQLANALLTDLRTAYGEDRHYIVTVSEDGENGSTVVYTPSIDRDGGFVALTAQGAPYEMQPV